MTSQYEVGDTLSYTSNGSDHRTGVVIEKDADIKNGRPGFIIEAADGREFWGYDSQIVSVRRAR